MVTRGELGAGKVVDEEGMRWRMSGRAGILCGGCFDGVWSME